MPVVSCGGDATVSGFQSSPLTSNVVGYPFLAVTAVTPTASIAFGASTITMGSSTSLHFTLNNNTPLTYTGVGVTDVLPAGLQVSSPNGLSGSCGGGTITAAAGSHSIGLSGATLAGFSSCTFAVNVAATAWGTLQTTTGAVVSNEGGTGAVSNSAVLTVSKPTPPPIVTPLVQVVPTAGIYGSASVSAIAVTSAIATGRITFSEGGTTLGSAPVIFGGATISVRALTAGVHWITAAYTGDAVNGNATSAPTAVTVLPASLTVAAWDTVRAAGSANPQMAGVVSGVQNGDALAVSCWSAATEASPPGTYAIIPTVVASEATLSNYRIALVNGTLTVTTAGWWWDPKLSGTAFFLEYGGQSRTGMFALGFGYDANGNATWIASTGPMIGSTYNGTWLRQSGGQTLTGP